jgi:hypothetical protein
MESTKYLPADLSILQFLFKNKKEPVSVFVSRSRPISYSGD